MKVIAGLGNPGNEYNLTRHNTGFYIIDSFADKHNLSFNKEKFGGLIAEGTIGKEKVILVKPQSYMNLSGEVIGKIVNFYKVDLKDLLIISDDLDQETGKIRFRSKGSAGGHNGLKNIELHLNTNEYQRMRVGISNNKMMNKADYVLGKFSIEEQKIFEKEKEKYIAALEDFIEKSFEQLMNKYN